MAVYENDPDILDRIYKNADLSHSYSVNHITSKQKNKRDMSKIKEYDENKEMDEVEICYTTRFNIVNALYNERILNEPPKSNTDNKFKFGANKKKKRKKPLEPSQSGRLSSRKLDLPTKS